MKTTPLPLPMAAIPAELGGPSATHSRPSLSIARLVQRTPLPGLMMSWDLSWASVPAFRQKRRQMKIFPSFVQLQRG
jgi:hypothetical protein